MGPADHGALVAVLSNPPLTDGQRTIRRVRLAADLLGFDEVIVANLFGLPSVSTRAIAHIGAAEEGWVMARAPLQSSLDVSGGVLIAYGVTPPTGPARRHFEAQLEWLCLHLTARDLPMWQVGDGPRHPSRWQRWTSRAHPNLEFPEALRCSLKVFPSTSPGPTSAGVRPHSLGRGPESNSLCQEGRYSTCRNAN